MSEFECSCTGYILPRPEGVHTAGCIDRLAARHNRLEAEVDRQKRHNQLLTESNREKAERIRQLNSACEGFNRQVRELTAENVRLERVYEAARACVAEADEQAARMYDPLIAKATTASELGVYHDAKRGPATLQRLRAAIAEYELTGRSMAGHSAVNGAVEGSTPSPSVSEAVEAAPSAPGAPTHCVVGFSSESPPATVSDSPTQHNQSSEGPAKRDPGIAAGVNPQSDGAPSPSVYTKQPTVNDPTPASAVCGDCHAPLAEEYFHGYCNPRLRPAAKATANDPNCPECGGEIFGCSQCSGSYSESKSGRAAKATETPQLESAREVAERLGFRPLTAEQQQRNLEDEMGATEVWKAARSTSIPIADLEALAERWETEGAGVINPVIANTFAVAARDLRALIAKARGK